MDEPLLRLELRGHAAVRATHAKTLEFGHDDAITVRATCVVGVGSVLVAGGAFAGPVRLVIDVGGERVSVDALGNPDWHAGGAAVVRRSSDRRPDTLATDADLGAADLPRGLVARLADPDARITVTAQRLPRGRDGRAGLVLLWTPAGAPAGQRLLAELAGADAVVADDPGAAQLLGPTRTAPAAAAGLLDGGLGRVLVVATGDLPGAGLGAVLARPDLVAVEVGGLPVTAAVVAASPTRGPVLQAGVVARGRIDSVLHAAPLAAGVVVTVAAADLPRLVEVAVARRATRTGALLEPAAGGRVTWGPLADLQVRRTSGDVVCFLDATPSDVPEVGEELAELVRALLAEGVSTRSVAMALASRPGWSRRTAYDAVLALRPET